MFYNTEVLCTIHIWHPPPTAAITILAIRETHYHQHVTQQRQMGPEMHLRPCYKFFLSFSFFFYFTNAYLPLKRLLLVQHHLDTSQAGPTMAHSPQLAMSSHPTTMKGAWDVLHLEPMVSVFFLLLYCLPCFLPAPLSGQGPNHYRWVRLPLLVWDIFAFVFLYMLI